MTPENHPCEVWNGTGGARATLRAPQNCTNTCSLEQAPRRARGEARDTLEALTFLPGRVPRPGANSAWSSELARRDPSPGRIPPQETTAATPARHPPGDLPAPEELEASHPRTPGSGANPVPAAGPQIPRLLGRPAGETGGAAKEPLQHCTGLDFFLSIHEYSCVTANVSVHPQGGNHP